MKKNIFTGLIAAMFGAMSAQANSEIPFKAATKPHKPTAKNKPSKSRLRFSEPSEYFGKRSSTVLATKPNGEQKLMKLKNALKHDFKFSFL